MQTGQGRGKPERLRRTNGNRRLEQRLQAMEHRIDRQLSAVSERLTELRVIVSGGDGPSLTARIQVMESKVQTAEGAALSAARWSTAVATVVGAVVGLAAPLLMKGGAGG